MSDSDDTDLLLLIPPDFFAVQSDIDESEQSVVDDLIIHVNDLENRISAIENSKSQLSLLDESLDLNQTKIKPANEYYLSMTDSLHSTNIDTLHLSGINDFIKGKSYKSPPKSRYPFTIPSTPISEVYNRTELLSPKSNYNESSDRYDASDNQMNVSNPSNIPVANKENDKIRQNGSDNCEEKELVHEIDQYLNEIDKCGPTGLFQKKEGLESISFNPTIMNDYKIDGFERHCNPELSKALDLPEVDRLLKEMEETQYEIEQKLKLHNSPKVFDKQVYYSHHLENNDYISNSSRKYVPSLKSGEIKIDGVNTLRDTSSFQSRYSPKSRKKLDMNFGHKNVEKYNTSNYRSYDDTSRKLDTLKSSLYSSSSPLKSTQTYGTKKLDSYKYLTPTKFNISKHLEAESLKDKPFVERQNQSDTEQLIEVSNQYTTEPNYVSKSKENSQDIGRERTESTFGRKRTTAQTTVDAIVNHDQQNISSKGILSSELKSGPTNLLSLTDLWNKEPLHNTDDPKKLRQKLEEEKYRREHCEEIIKNLQYRVLEDQEKLAVAVHVDQEKDKAIVQLTEAWRKLVQHWGELENQRHNLSLQLQTEKSMSRSKLEEMAKKVTQCETEVAQALDLAAGYKKKYEDINREKDTLKNDLKHRIEEAEKQIEEVSEQNQQYIIERNDMKSVIDEFKKKSEEEKKLLEEGEAEIQELKKQVSQYEAEIKVLKEQKEMI
uniref:Uncharacterized protein n=1 Tax=Clastoptera arizonana TaxID=38151 RepID=A0A1B6CMZ3_9HEMI